MQDLKILHLEVDNTGLESYYRVLVDGKHFKYIPIDSGVYDVEDLTWPQALIPKLPQLSTGEWSLGHITRSEKNNSPHFDIEHLWHPVSIDYLSLAIVKKLLPNVYEATTPEFDVPVIAKFARFPWETGYYNQETQVYSWITGHDIGPEFLGHIREGERVIGFLLRKVVGRHTRPGDVKLCKAAVSKLHGLKILNRDLNKYNFLVQSTRAFLIDFESATKMEDQHALDMELESLEGNLTSNSTRGGNYNVSEALV